MGNFYLVFFLKMSINGQKWLEMNKSCKKLSKGLNKIWIKMADKIAKNFNLKITKYKENVYII